MSFRGRLVWFGLVWFRFVSQTTVFGLVSFRFAKYSFWFRFVSFRKVQFLVWFGLVWFRFVSQTTVSPIISLHLLYANIFCSQLLSLLLLLSYLSKI